VSLYRLADNRTDATWTVAMFNPGDASRESCQQALNEIDGRLQKIYDLVPESAGA